MLARSRHAPLDAAATIGVTEVLARGFPRHERLARAAPASSSPAWTWFPPHGVLRRMIFGPSALP